MTKEQVLKFLEENIQDSSLKEKIAEALESKKKRVSDSDLEPHHKMLLGLSKGLLVNTDLLATMTHLKQLRNEGHLASSWINIDLDNNAINAGLNLYGQQQAKLLAERVAKFEKEGVFCSVCGCNKPYKDALFCQDPYDLENSKDGIVPKQWFCTSCYSDRLDSV